MPIITPRVAATTRRSAVLLSSSGLRSLMTMLGEVPVKTLLPSLIIDVKRADLIARVTALGGVRAAAGETMKLTVQTCTSAPALLASKPTLRNAKTVRTCSAALLASTLVARLP